MELKKNPKADLENRRGLYLEIGLVVVLVGCLVAFNVKSYDQDEKVVEQRTAVDEIEDVMIQTAEDPPPPPPPEQPEVTTELTIVEDDAEIENELGIVNAEVDENTQNIEIAPVPVEEVQEEVEEEIFLVVESEPEFPGGIEKLYEYFGKNIKYPALARENNLTGRVFITFVVEKDGSISNAKVLRDIGGGCGAEAVRVAKGMPKWKPGKQQGKAVRVQYNLPVIFNLK